MVQKGRMAAALCHWTAYIKMPFSGLVTAFLWCLTESAVSYLSGHTKASDIAS